MTNKTPIPTRIKEKDDAVHPGMMGDGTEEQNLDQRGNAAARITKEEVNAAFAKKHSSRQSES